jgi:hypothetical protein
MNKKEYLLLFLGLTAIAVTGVFIYKSVKGLSSNITKEQKEELDIKIVRTDNK